MSLSKITDNKLETIAKLWQTIVNKPFSYYINPDFDTLYPEFIRQMQRTLGHKSSLKVIICNSFFFN